MPCRQPQLSNSGLARSGNTTDEYPSLVAGCRDENGKTRQFWLGEASKLHGSGELDRIVEVLTVHAQRRWVDTEHLEVDHCLWQRPASGN